MYILAIICPPLAVLLCGKPVSAILNLLLTAALFWVGGVIHAILVVNGRRADKRNAELIKAVNGGNAAQLRLSLKS